MPATVSEAPAVSMSCQYDPSEKVLCADLRAVANNFWGKDDAGVQPLFERMHSAKVTSEELKNFYGGKHATWFIISSLPY